MELQHFSHDHPLILHDQANDGDSSSIVCNGCVRPVSGDTYECRQCEFVLHKSCVELPQQIIHFFHPKHPLTLLSKSPYGNQGNPRCNNCVETIWGFMYHCYTCDFDLDIKCVQLGPIVNHEGHQHSFMLLRPWPEFTCDICEEKTFNATTCYLCSTCQLWVHKHCAAASLPITDSTHTFNLRSTFPTVVEDLQESRDAASQEEQAVSLITCDVFNKMSLEENDMLSTIQHFSHPCQLILTNDDKPLNEETYDELENEEICDEQQNAKICDACVRPISAPFYKCAKCKFFLHPTCAQLPTTIRSLLHPHPLTLRVKTSMANLYSCSTCLHICTGFAYECKFCVEFEIDVRCASISKNTLKHDGHEHILSLVQKRSKSYCSACSRICITKFRCEDCNFNLGLRCALLPLTARLGWDEEKHPLKLTFVNVENTAKFYFCDLCEEVRNTDDWYYCCRECDRSAHTTCLFGNYDIKFGASYEDKELHEHSLRLVLEKSKNKYRCKNECDIKHMVLECPTCDYHTHMQFTANSNGGIDICE